MKITIEHGDQTAILEDENVVDICDAVDLMEKALVEIGYAQERVRGAFLVKAREIGENRKR